MNRLVVEEFEWSIVPLLVVLLRLRTRFCRPLLPHVLDLDVESNYAAFHYCLISSTYAEGSCDSDVPFCDTYNTQLHVDLLLFFLLVLSVGILLEGCILHVA